jgi:hypothetical protein
MVDFQQGGQFTNLPLRLQVNPAIKVPSPDHSFERRDSKMPIIQNHLNGQIVDC